MRRAGVLVRPRYADGRNDVVTGYSVAARPQRGERPIWYGGGHLGRDLALPRLRAAWSDTPTSAAGAVGEWNAAMRHRRPVAPGREATTEPDPRLWEEYTRDIARLHEQLRTVPIEDRELWARVARETAGAFAAWSQRVETTPGPLAAAADALARSAQTKRAAPRVTKAGLVAVSGAAMLLASASRGGQGVLTQVAMLRQLGNLAAAVYDMHQRAGEVRQAEAVARTHREQLRIVHDRLRAVAEQQKPSGTATTTTEPAVERARAGLAPLREPGSPVPTRIEPAVRRTPTRPGPDRGTER